MFRKMVGMGALCFLCAACSHPPVDPPAIPDAPRYTPTLPTYAEFQNSDTVLLAPVDAPKPQVSPVDIPPPDAVAIPQKKQRKGKESTIIPKQDGQSEAGSAIVKYKYHMGAIYQVPVGVNHPVTFLFPLTLHLSAPPILDKDQWGVVRVVTGKEDTYQDKLSIRPFYTGLDATTPLMFDTGQFFLVQLKSQDASGTLAVTWEMPPTVQPQANAKLVKLPPAGPQPPKIALDRLHIQYKLEPGKVSVSWFPAEAYDDGNITVIRFAESLKFTSSPILTAVEGKRTVPVEYTVFAVPDHPEKGEFYVTRGLYPRLQLRDGKGGIVTIIRLPTPEPTYTEKRS